MSGEAQPAPVAALLGAALLLPGVAQIRAQDTDWPTITGGNDAHRYAALDRIDASNFARLEPAWRWELPDNDLMANDPRFEDGSMKQRTHVTTPIKVGDRLYVRHGLRHRRRRRSGNGRHGLAARSAELRPRPTHEPRLHPQGSEPLARPGASGTRRAGSSTPARTPSCAPSTPTRARRCVRSAITAASISRRACIEPSNAASTPSVRRQPSAAMSRSSARPSRTVRWDPTTARRATCAASTSAPAGNSGRSTPCPRKASTARTPGRKSPWRIAGGANVWGLMSADEELGLAYLPTSTPTNDWYGGHRRGDNLYAESLVAVDCETGERRWHFQAIHHGLWDYDFAAPAVLGDLVVDGRTVKAAMLPSKQAFLYVFDRETGEPLWPIEERQVPQTGIPGERTSATQPFPTRPPPFDRQGMRLADVIDFTPEIRAEAERILTSRQYGPIYTPPSERGTVAMPGFEGGASWPGGAFDPERGPALRAVLHGADPDHAAAARPEPLLLRLRGKGVRLPRPLRPADLKAAVLAGDRLRHEPRRHRVAGPARRRPATPPEARRPGPPAAGLGRPRPRARDEDASHREFRPLAVLPRPGGEGGTRVERAAQGRHRRPRLDGPAIRRPRGLAIHRADCCAP